MNKRRDAESGYGALRDAVTMRASGDVLCAMHGAGHVTWVVLRVTHGVECNTTYQTVPCTIMYDCMT